MIYLMRHGQSVVNVERRLTCRQLEGDLTDTGREQARRAAAWFAGKDIARIRVSPFHRTQQTAAFVAEALHVAPEIDDDLREMDCGQFEGRTGEAAWEEWGVIYEQWLQGNRRASFPGGETFGNALDRLQRALLACPADGRSTLLVTHGGVTRTTIPYLCVNAAALQRITTLNFTGIIVLEPYGDGRFICESWNLAEHLEGMP